MKKICSNTDVFQEFSLPNCGKSAEANRSRKARENFVNTGSKLRGHNALQIDNNIYNIEVQSTEDGTMALRMFEYAVYGARMHGGVFTAKGRVTLSLPRMVVLYIRSDDDTPEYLMIEVSVYDELEETEKTLEYSVRTKRIHDYTPTEVAEQCLYILLPLFPLKFERMLSKAHTADVEKLVTTELHELKQTVDTLVEVGKLEPHIGVKILAEAHDMVQRLLANKNVAKNILEKEELVRTMTDLEETVAVTYTWDEAVLDNSCRITLNLLREGINFSTIVKCSGLDESDVRILADEYGIAVSA